MLGNLKVLSLVAAGAALTAAAPTTGKWFDHVMLIQFENHSDKEVIKDPNFDKYRQKGRSLDNYFAVAHPSQPNYIAQIGGDTLGVTGDGTFNLAQKSLVDLLEAKDISWKGYMEDYPGNCFAGNQDRYVRKHNPFISFDLVRNNATRCAKIVASTQLDTDMKNGGFPQFSFFSPNLDNDAHDTTIAYGGKWLDTFLTARLSQFPANSLIVVSWDEDDYTEANQILVFLLDPKGTLFTVGSKDTTPYNHYSFLATVEQNWNLGNLGRKDATATVFNFKA